MSENSLESLDHQLELFIENIRQVGGNKIYLILYSVYK